MVVKVMLADDHQLFLAGLESLLAKEKDIDIIGTATSGREVILKVPELKPHVLVLDINMPGLNGIDVTHNLSTLGLPTKIVCLSMHSDKRYVLEMLKAGAVGYLLKDSSFEELTKAIRTVIHGKIYISTEIAGIVARELVSLSKEDEGAFSVLSTREREVLQLIAEGKSTKEIAFVLHLSPKTVETHRSRIMQKLEVGSVAELTKYAIREGLTSLDS